LGKIPAKVLVKIVIVGVRSKESLIEFLKLLLAMPATKIQILPTVRLSWKTRFRPKVFNRVIRWRTYRKTIAERTVLLRLFLEGRQKEFVDRLSFEFMPIESGAFIIRLAALPIRAPSLPVINEKIWLIDALEFPHF